MEGFIDIARRATSAAAHGTHRFSRSALCGIALACAASAFAAAGDGGLNDPNITFVGRWDNSISGTRTSHWGGASLTTRFTGRSISVKLASKTTLKAVIDGTLYTFPDWAQSVGTDGVIVNLTPTALSSDGPHTLQLAVHYDTLEMPFKGLMLAAGATTQPVEPRPLVEFIGDSITAGQGAADWALGDYAWRTGEALGVHHTQIARAGITLADGYRYKNDWPGMESMYFKSWVLPELCDGEQSPCPRDANHQLPNPAWDFSKYSPKVVVVNLGTNDMNLKVPLPEFQDKYTKFLANLRDKHPAAQILVLRTFNNYNAKETEAAVLARISANDTKVRYIDTDGWLTMHPSADFADGFHPNDNGYKKVRDRLTPIILPYLGGVTSVNDTQFRYDNTANWPAGWQSGAWQNDNHWSNVTNASYELPFDGSQVHLYGAKAAWHGIAAVSVDGGPETQVDTYSATRTDGAWLWSSEVLSPGPHKLKVRVTGLKNASSTGTYVVADRVDVVNRAVNLLANAGFENGLSGWSVVSQGASQSTVNGTSPRNGSFQLTHSSTTPYWAATFQTLSGLSNGLYTARAWVKGTAGHEFYVKNFGGASVRAVSPSSTSAYTELVIRDINVTNGSAEIGFWTNDTVGGGWLNVDDVRFYKQ